MKTITITTSCLAAWMLACGGGAAQTPAAQPTTPAPASAQPVDTTPAGDADNEVIPDKPKPFISVGSLFAAGKGVAAATPLAQPTAVDKAETDRLVERIFVLFTELADGAAAATGDCDAMAASVQSWGERNIPELQTMMPKLEKLDQTMTQDQQAALEKRMQPIVEKLSTALQSCSDNQAVMGAFMEIGKALDGAEDPNEGVEKDSE